MTEYPVKVTMSSKAMTELRECEYGSYEDNVGYAGDERQGEYADGTLHIVELIDRSPHKTVVYLQSQAEVDEFFAQAVSGTFGLYCPGVCQRIYDELLPLVSDAVPEWIRKSPMIGH